MMILARRRTRIDGRSPHRCVRSLALLPALLVAVALLPPWAEAQDEPAAQDETLPLPKASELREALQGQIDNLNEEAMRLLPDDAGAAFQVEIDGMLLHRCVPVDDDPRSFDCRMDLRLALPNQRPETKLVTIRLTRLVGEWQVN
jgi:hypothetical protein